MARNLFHFTIDVDYTLGTTDGLDHLLEFCDKHALKATYFISGKFAEEYPDHIRQIHRRGYELGTHGWLHGEDPIENFWLPDVASQAQLIANATDAVEAACGHRPRLFRAPNLRINEQTFTALSSLGYVLDSSIPSRRLSPEYQRRVPKQFFAPLTKYYPKDINISKRKRDADGILEVPPSSYFLPFNMSALRVFGLSKLKWVAKTCVRKSGFLNFYVHPIELTDPKFIAPRPHEPKRYLEGLGPHNLDILDQLVRWTKDQELVSAFLSEQL